TISITPSSTSIQSTTSVKDTAQINVEDSTNNIDSANIPLPPESERRDFDLIANTNMKWVRYLLDQNGPEFSFMAKYIENIFNKLFKDVSGFVKTDIVEFLEEKVTFNLIIYTKKTSKVTKIQLENLVSSYVHSGKDVLKIYAFEVKPRFQELLDLNVSVNPDHIDADQHDRGFT
ncbi:hypothetical protein QZH41_015872, partial [Actinostola sp. cb2023]